MQYISSEAYYGIIIFYAEIRTHQEKHDSNSGPKLHRVPLNSINLK